MEDDSMADLGTYYIQIMPSAKGIGNNIEKELNNEMGDAGEKAGGVFSGGFGKVLATGGKVALAASAAVATGIAVITKQAVSNYAEYEQLVGGIEKLYGDAADTVKQYANDAFKTVGMSANQYMASTTAFSAKLLNDFGGDSEKAAEYANKAMMQIADNANTFGKFSVDELTQVYQALARGSYMTLDNLNLGFTGTKEGMQELLDKAEELTGVKYDINNFNDIIDAIGAVQDSLNITGTTANEAMGTISGSINMTKAAWENLVTGIANPDADLGTLISDLVTSATAAVNNLLPVVQQALVGVVQFVGEIIPPIIDMLPGLLDQLIPVALSAFGNVMGALMGVLPQLLQVALDAILMIAEGLQTNLPTIIPYAVDIILQIANTLMSNLGDLLTAAVEIILALVQGLTNATPTLLAQAPVIIQNLTDSIIQVAPLLISACVQIMNIMVSGIIQNLPQLISAALQIITTLTNGIIANIPVLLSAASQCCSSFSESFGEIDWGTLGTNIINGIVAGISASASSIASAARQAAQSALDSAKSLLGIKSPSRVFRDQVGQMIGEGMAEGISDSENAVNRAMAELSNGTLGKAQIAVSANSRMTSSPSYGEAMQAQLAGVGNITIPVYIGQQKFAQAVVNAQNVMNYRSGGR
jgi:phage-related protein